MSLELARRADLLIAGIQAMFDRGVNPCHILDMEEENPEINPRRHRDLWLVYLGLKPVATHLTPVTGGQADCFNFLPNSVDWE